MTEQEISEINVENFDEKITFGVDLVDASLRQLNFIGLVENDSKFFDKKFLQCALQRYEKYWLPLVADNEDKILPAPWDIEWVWHCHMLSPVNYEEVCREMFGHTINHKLFTNVERDKEIGISKNLWSGKYPDVSFELQEVPEVIPEFESKITYDIVAAAQRQHMFNYQVSLPHFKDKKYLQEAVRRYKKMLFLKLKNPGVFLVPCYDMDLVWHSHQLHPGSYKPDTEKLLGRIFNHDDSVTERTPGSKLNKADEKTREVWKETFNEHFSKAGAMYRGDPPNASLDPPTETEVRQFSTKTANVNIDHVEIEGLPAELRKFKIKIHLMANDREGPQIGTLKGPGRTWDKKKKINFTFDTKLHNTIKFTLLQIHKPFCVSTFEQMGQCIFQMLSQVENSSYENETEISETLILDEEQNIRIHVKASVKLISKTGPCLLFLKNGNYDNRICIMPEHVTQMWGPIPLPRLPTGKDNQCIVATHK